MKKFLGVILSVLLLASPCLAVSTDTCFDTDAKYMLHMDGADAGTTFTDSSTAGHTWTRVADATTSTTQVKFGTASMHNTTGYIYTANNADIYPGTSDFTIDLWVYWTTVGSTFLFDAGVERIGLRYSSGFLDFYSNGAVNNNEATWTPNVNTWYHIAVVRSSGTLYIFIDGVSQTLTSSANALNITGAAQLDIGIGEEVAAPMVGYIDEVRWVIGTAVWTSNFTKPSAAYSQCGVGGGSSAMMQFFED